MADTSDKASLAGLVGGLVESAGKIASSAETSSQARQATKEREELFNQYRKQMSPDVIAAGIERIAGNLSAAEKNNIIRMVTEHFAGAGTSGAGGMLAEAVAQALANARLQLLQQAQGAYFKGQEMPSGALPPIPAAGGGIGNPFKSVVDYFLTKKPAPDKPSLTPSTESKSTADTPVLGSASFFAPTPDDAAAGAGP